MRFLYRKEREDKEFDWPARTIFDGVSQGLRESEAAVRAGVGPEELRSFRRDPTYRAAVKRARTEDRASKFWTFDVPEEDAELERLATVGSRQEPIFGPAFLGAGINR